MGTQCFRGSRQMTGPQSAENGKPLSGAECPNGSEIGSPAGAAPQDRLEYIADMVRELKIMSAQANCPVLSDLLEHAYREAMRQRSAGV
jgi:hypothetical protein